MRINTNISAMNTYSRLTSANSSKAGSLAKLSSGLRINKAGDDAAGLSISEKMRGQVSGLKQSVRNAQDGISLIQTAEGALSETHSILQRMRELSVQSANDTNTNEDRMEIQKEVDELSAEVTRIGETTQFNTQNLLDGTYTGKKFHIGANTGQDTGIDISNMKAKELSVADELTAASGTLGSYKYVAKGADVINATGSKDAITAKVAGYYAVDSTNHEATLRLEKETQFTVDDKVELGINVHSQNDANDAIKTIDTAISNVSAERSKLGATQNRLEHTINNLNATSENLSEAESRIRDVDMAEEMMEFTKSNILSQAATAMLAQANQMPQGVLQLLQ